MLFLRPARDFLAECHVFEKFGKAILFNVETMLYYETTPLVFRLIRLLQGSPEKDPVKTLKRNYHRQDIDEALIYLKQEKFLHSSPSKTERPKLRKRYGIRHLELMVTHGCNLRCRYCYGRKGEEDWQGASHLYGSESAGMTLETAKLAVDFLFRESGNQDEISVVFFGGEPLLEFKLIQEITTYIRRKEKREKKKVRLSLSTNGLLLTDEVVSFLCENRISCQVSIDGDRSTHDRSRCMKDGGGSYDEILPGISRLMSQRRNRVPARMTVTGGEIRLLESVEHLLKLGFGSVQAEPVIGDWGDLCVSSQDVDRIMAEEERIAKLVVEEVRGGNFFNYSNLVSFIRDTKTVRERLAFHCGAARTYLAMAQDGSFYPCHRFVGMDEYRMGDVRNGFDRSLQKQILDLSVDERSGCRDCWARYLCGGGCWKTGVDRNNCLSEPDLEVSCRIIRNQIECAMAINSELKSEEKAKLAKLYDEACTPQIQLQQ